MTDKEYEYSFKVKDLFPFINYCIDNNYNNLEDANQTRILYKKEDHTMARITISEVGGSSKMVLDFKEHMTSNGFLNKSRESSSIVIDDIEGVENVLLFLNYKKEITLTRRRLVYEKDKVIFEIDDYTSPEQVFVVAIEGEKNNTDKVYKEITKRYKDYIL